MSEPRWSIAPYFLVDDVIASANYYRDKLGFRYDRFWGEPPEFCMVHRRGITIMLKQRDPGTPLRSGPNRLSDPEDSHWDAYIWVEDAPQLYQEFQSKGVKIARPLCEQEYGNIDFDVEDLNGYRLCFGSDLKK